MEKSTDGGILVANASVVRNEELVEVSQSEREDAEPTAQLT